MFLLDTDVVIWLLRGREDIVEFVSRVSKKSSLSISVITIAEIYQNIFPAELTDTEEHINHYLILDIDTKIAKIGGLYWQQYAKQLKNLSLTDCLIAATANTTDATLVSLNTKHFPMKELTLLNPLKSGSI
jgi:predicted nucleic acid-binding protein